MKNNIILLALSTLQKERKVTGFEIMGDNSDPVFSGESEGSMEPIAQYALANPEFKKGNITFIVLCTKETLENDKNYAEETAYEHFKERVRKFACGEEYKNGFNEKYENSISFKNVEINENNPNDGIYKAVNEIRKIDSRGLFWIDTHGGFRDVTLMMEGIVSLLKIEGIKPDKIYGVRYSEGKARFVNQKNSFMLFDFVAGVNEFINSGNATMLNDYYEANPDDEFDDALKAINKVSDGLRECNPGKYLEGLDELSKLILKFDDQRELLGIFAENIKRSYGDLLYKKKRKTTALIRRCVEKNQLQQALTLLETLMPEEFYKAKLFWFEQKEMDSLKNRYSQNGKNVTLVNKYETDKRFVFNKYVINDHNKYSTKINKLYPKPVKEFIKRVVSGRCSELSHNFLGKTDPIINTYSLSLKRMSGIEYEIHIKTCITAADEWKEMALLMRMHRALKECRNDFNHCDPDRADSMDIKNVLIQYLDLSEKLLNGRI